MRLAICSKCGACFQPIQGNDRLCAECLSQPKTASPVFCQIEEAPGRCQGYMKGICEACLDFCAAENWIGWRAVNGCEWWKKAEHYRVYQTTHTEYERDSNQDGENKLLRREIIDIFADSSHLSALP